MENQDTDDTDLKDLDFICEYPFDPCHPCSHLPNLHSCLKKYLKHYKPKAKRCQKK